MLFKDIKTNEIFNCINLVTQLGLIMVGSILLGGFMGYMLDRALGMKPCFTIILGLVGIGGGFVSAYKTIIRSIEDDDGKAGK